MDALDTLQAIYEAECNANACGPIGAEDVPPHGYEPKRDRERQARKSRRDRIRTAKSNGYREPGTRHVRRVLARAQACGVRSVAIAHEWLSHDMDTMPNPVRLSRILEAEGFVHVDAWTHLRVPEPTCDVCGDPDPVTIPHHDGGDPSTLCPECTGDLFGDEAEDFAWLQVEDDFARDMEARD